MYSGVSSRTREIATLRALGFSATPVRIGFIWAVVIALLGGIFPAIRAGRIPVATALRAA